MVENEEKALYSVYVLADGALSMSIPQTLQTVGKKRFNRSIENFKLKVFIKRWSYERENFKNWRSHPRSHREGSFQLTALIEFCQVMACHHALIWGTFMFLWQSKSSPRKNLSGQFKFLSLLRIPSFQQGVKDLLPPLCKFYKVIPSLRHHSFHFTISLLLQSMVVDSLYWLSKIKPTFIRMILRYFFLISKKFLRILCEFIQTKTFHCADVLQGDWPDYVTL